MQKMFSNRDLTRLIVPLFIEQLLLMVVGMADTVMVSIAGEAAISGVSIVNDVNNLIIQLLAALAGGGAVIVSQYLGLGDERKTRLSASQLVMISGLISFGFGLFSLLFYQQILQILYSSVEVDVMNAAKTYFWITALSFPFLGIYNSGAALYRSMNRTNTTMFVSILMNVINIVGNYIGVYILHLGVAGVAWPTLLSRMVAAVIMIGLSFNQENPVSIDWKDIFSWHGAELKKILTIAVPNGVENGLFQFGKILLSMFVTTYGTSQIAANGVVNSLCTLCYATEAALQLAVVSIIGRCVGANDYPQAEYYTKKFMKLGILLAFINNAFAFLIMPYALKLYTLSSETYDLALFMLRMECVAIIFLHTLAFVLPSAMRAAGDAKYTMLIGVASMFISRVGGAYLLGTVLRMGVSGTRLAWYIDWTTRLLLFVHRYRSKKWENYRMVG
jgi:putative MATE family efflux protein